jgi:alpha-glucosidase
LEFFDQVPTVWDDTKVIQGRIGQFAIMARRKGENWFMGCMNSGQARRFEVPLDFLDPGKTYRAHVYIDDPQIPTRTQVRIERYGVDRDSVLQMDVSAQGGQAVRLVAQ